MHRIVKAQVKSEERIRARRADIVEAATRVFKKKGFHEASIRDVGLAAGLTQGSLYNYIRSKDDVLYLVCAEMTARYTEQVMDAIAGIEDPAVRLRVAVGALVRCMHANRDGIRLVYQESHALQPASKKAVMAQMSNFIAFFEGIFREAAEKYLTVSPMLAADIVTFVPTLLALRGWHLQKHTELEKVVAEVTAFTLRGLGLDSKALVRKRESASRRVSVAKR
jgi:AcrR family transcriptional regulator